MNIEEWILVLILQRSRFQKKNDYKIASLNLDPGGREHQNYLK